MGYLRPIGGLYDGTLSIAPRRVLRVIGTVQLRIAEVVSFTRPQSLGPIPHNVIRMPDATASHEGVLTEQVWGGQSVLFQAGMQANKKRIVRTEVTLGDERGRPGRLSTLHQRVRERVP